MKLTILQTQKEGPSPPELAKQALKQGADVVLVSGGDGTVGAVAGALVDTGADAGLAERCGFTGSLVMHTLHGNGISGSGC